MSEEIVVACACIGPTHGMPLCGCGMRAADPEKLMKYLTGSHNMLFELYMMLTEISELPTVGGKYIKAEHIDLDKIGETAKLLKERYFGLREGSMR